MINPVLLEESLQKSLPSHLHLHIPQLILFLKTLLEETNNSDQEEREVANVDPQVRALIQALLGKQIITEHAVVSFGEHSQTGSGAYPNDMLS